MFTNIPKGILCLLVLVLLTVSHLAAAPQDQKDSEAQPTFEQRISRLIERLEKKRKDLHIPGMSIAVVKDDKVVLTHGFGFADLENNILYDCGTFASFD